MKREELRRAFDSIGPSREAEKRMLNNILYKSGKAREEKTRPSFSFRKAVPVLAIALVVVAGIALWGIATGNLTGRNADDGRLIANDSIGSGPGREDAVYVLKDQFQLGERHYILLRDEQRKEYGLPGTISDGDIGDKIAVISTSVDESLVGLEVYRYIPAGGEGVVAVKREDSWQLFRFLSFESYINNKDEDARAYLELYGIYSADDIEKILFIGHSERAKLENRMEILAELTDMDRIKTFYDYYSAIPDSSERYFDKLFGNTGSDHGGEYVDAVPDPAMPEKSDRVVPPVLPDYRDGVIYDMPVAPDYTGQDAVPDPSGNYGTEPANAADDLAGRTSAKSGVQPGYQGETSASYSGSVGSDALGNPITIRIYNRSGVYLETVYYPNMGFISRHEVNDEFAAFLRGCMAK
jgi:hypothetical protein